MREFIPQQSIRKFKNGPAVLYTYLFSQKICICGKGLISCQQAGNTLARRVANQETRELISANVREFC